MQLNSRKESLLQRLHSGNCYEKSIHSFLFTDNPQPQMLYHMTKFESSEVCLNFIFWQTKTEKVTAWSWSGLWCIRSLGVNPAQSKHPSKASAKYIFLHTQRQFRAANPPKSTYGVRKPERCMWNCTETPHRFEKRSMKLWGSNTCLCATRTHNVHLIHWMLHSQLINEVKRLSEGSECVGRVMTRLTASPMVQL